jgi:hypothetical protein
MKRFLFTFGLVGAAIVAAITVLGSEPGYAQALQTTPPASVAPETVTVNAPHALLQPFDMKQCYEDGRGCQLATCASTQTLSGTIVVCQSHGNFFP